MFLTVITQLINYCTHVNLRDLTPQLYKHYHNYALWYHNYGCGMYVGMWYIVLVYQAESLSYIRQIRIQWVIVFKFR